MARHGDEGQAGDDRPGPQGAEALPRPGPQAGGEGEQAAPQAGDGGEAEQGDTDRRDGDGDGRRDRSPEVGEDVARRPGQHAPDRPRAREHDGRADHDDDHLTRRPLEDDGPGRAIPVTHATAVVDGAVHVAEHPRRQDRVEELGAITVAQRAAEPDRQTQPARDHAPPRRRRRGRHQPDAEGGDDRAG
ncbi:hypothetical protein Acsp06_52460 [Actinomycetospora sp. NBRC 106375]|nr:hypothetical protein Acsp06_52460 [Actinomycetospora sp. NBRC 106375]